MRKVYRVRTVTNSQHMKGSQRLLKSARQYFCQFFWWLWKRISWNNSVLLVSEILRLFVNMLTPDDMYSLSRKSTFHATNSNAIIFKWKNILSNFLCISGIYINFVILWRKNEPRRLFVSEIIDYKKRGYLND